MPLINLERSFQIRIVAAAQSEAPRCDLGTLDSTSSCSFANANPNANLNVMIRVLPRLQL